MLAQVASAGIVLTFAAFVLVWVMFESTRK